MFYLHRTVDSSKIHSEFIEQKTKFENKMKKTTSPTSVFVVSLT